MFASPGNDYRRELDGLRSIAVISVVLYHFEIPPFRGGFVGVDIFFVLSGFFIGGILWRQVTENGRIDYTDFLMRRIRRLAPAYFTMILVVSVFAYFLLLPFEYRSFGKEVVSSVLYFSNIIYFRDSGYFDVGAENKVLLHTWSLSVEEQFYIFLPILMALLSRRTNLLFLAVVFVFLTSLAANIWLTPISQTATFYLFPFRAWELLTGVLLAICGQRYRLSWSVHPALSWIGIALVLVSVMFIPAGESFPGLLAIPPVLGTALLILNGRSDTIVNRLLSQPVPVFFGLISYSLYLWHWPIVTLAAYSSNGDLGGLLKIALIALSVLLAGLSWRFVETPVRRRGAIPNLPVLGAAAAASAVALSSGLFIYVRDGVPDRFPPEIRTHIDASGDFYQDFSRCRTPQTGAWAGVEICPIGPDGEPRVLIWGDSHVRAFKEGLEQAAWEAETSALLIWNAGCPPLFGLAKAESSTTPAQDEACTATNRRIASALDSLEDARSLLLIGRWSYYADGTGSGRDMNNTIRLSPNGDGTASGDTNVSLLESSWRHSLQVFESRFDNIYLLRQVPEISWYNSREVARRIAHGHLDTSAQVDALTIMDRGAAEARATAAEAAMRVPDGDASVHVIDSWPEFCTPSICSAMQGGFSNYFDNNHITNTAARRIRHLFAPIFENAGKGPNS